MTAARRALAIGAFIWALTISGTEGTRAEFTPADDGRVGQIEGSIVDDALEPMAEVPVTLATKGRPIARATTDSEGTFRFRQIALGTYDLTAGREGYTGVRKTVPLMRAGATIQLGLAMPRDAARLGTLSPTVPSLQPHSIYGRVTDTAGGNLPGVTVTVQGPALSAPRVALSSATGVYEFTGLPAGVFTLDFRLSGFKFVTRSGLIPRKEEAIRLDVTLDVGSLTEEVTVTAAAPEKPPTARDPWQIVTVTPGVQRGLNVGGSSSGDQIGLESREQLPQETARYARVEANQFRLTSAEPLSTFGADVDTASFANIRRFLNEGRLPPTDAVRVEEFVNYFSFDYDAPIDDRALALTTEVGNCPWAPAHKLVLVGARARAAAVAEAPRNIVFLIDVSGSMQPAERLPLLRTALGMFVDTLRPTDEISIVTYAGRSGLALAPTTARHRGRIQDAIASLGAGGSTNGAAGLRLAYRLAREEFVPGGVNRIILATDGDFNVGTTGRDDLYRLIDREKRSGVFLSVLGVGTNNLKDDTMEMLADKGNGHYAYFDSLQEARRVLIREGDSTLETVAKDVKFQVEFNPATVQAWRLIGYENRLMPHEAFNDDRKDGGELGAGHTVTVLYEVVPTGEALPSELTGEERPVLEPLVYQERRPSAAATARNELMTVRVRYTQSDESDSVMFTSVVKTGGRSEHIPFASAVAEFGLLLRDADPAPARWDALLARVQSMANSPDPSGDRTGFVRMVELARGLRSLK